LILGSTFLCIYFYDCKYYDMKKWILLAATVASMLWKWDLKAQTAQNLIPVAQYTRPWWAQLKWWGRSFVLKKDTTTTTTTDNNSEEVVLIPTTSTPTADSTNNHILHEGDIHNNEDHSRWSHKETYKISLWTALKLTPWGHHDIEFWPNIATPKTSYIPETENSLVYNPVEKDITLIDRVPLNERFAFYLAQTLGLGEEREYLITWGISGELFGKKKETVGEIRGIRFIEWWKNITHKEWWYHVAIGTVLNFDTKEIKLGKR